jgi:hypothetical protein
MTASQSNSPFLWSKRRVALVGLCAAVAAGVAVHLDAGEFILLVVFPCLAWLVWKRLGISGIGMVFWAAALELMTWASAITIRSEGNVFVIIPFAILMLAAVACVLAAVIAMLVSAWWRPPLRRRNLLGALLVPVASVVLALAVDSLLLGARELRIARCFRENRAILQALVDDVDAISQRLGRVPKNEEELVKLREEPMPRIPWPEWGHHDLRYHAISEHRFALCFGGIDAEGVYVYDSGTPERGWCPSWRPPWRSQGNPSE